MNWFKTKSTLRIISLNSYVQLQPNAIVLCLEPNIKTNSSRLFMTNCGQLVRLYRSEVTPLELVFYLL